GDVGAGLEPLARRPGRHADVHAQGHLVAALDEAVEPALGLEDQDQVGLLGAGLEAEAAAD
ncbi:hypothetical protein HK102_011757, partial [Quaeritorhiza haematococci]